jgi:hypothetical protein
MSLFEYAQELLVSKTLKKRESPMLSVSMGTQPVMPMAQGGGLSSVQNSLNINGQPHRLAYINPSEADLLKQLGGSGRKIDGIPAYYDAGNDSDPDSGDTTGGFGGPGPDDGTSGVADDVGAVTGTPGNEAEAQAQAEAEGEAAAYSDVASQAQGLGFGGTSGGPGSPTALDAFYSEANQNREQPTPRGFFDNLDLWSLPLAPLATLAKAGITTARNNNFGIDPMGVVGNVGHAPSEDDDDNADDYAGGDDYIIKELIAKVKEVPVEEVEKEEVAKVKRLTSKERIADTGIEEIIREMYGQQMTNRLLNINRPTIEEEKENDQAALLDEIYGPGASAGLSSLTTNNTGTA